LYFSLVSGTLACVTVTAARKLRLSPKRRAQLKLQGQYMAYLRALKPKQKAEVKRLREMKGMQAALVRVRRLGSKV